MRVIREVVLKNGIKLRSCEIDGVFGVEFKDGDYDWIMVDVVKDEERLASIWNWAVDYLLYEWKKL